MARSYGNGRVPFPVPVSGADRSGRPRRGFAIGVARLVTRLAWLTAHHGTALPGLVAEWIDPTILAELADGLGPVIVVLGTNGKTTTTRLVATILEHAHGVPPVSNRSGANMRQGVVSAIIGDRPSRRAAARPAAVFEVDELAFAGVVTALHPAAVVILNLLRDQLDRYGEIDRVEEQWVRDLAMLPPETMLITCADDPRVEADRTAIRSRGAAIRGVVDRRQQQLRSGMRSPNASPRPGLAPTFRGAPSAGRAWRSGPFRSAASAIGAARPAAARARNRTSG